MKSRLRRSSASCRGSLPALLFLPVVVSMLTACASSAPIHLYTLSATPDAAPAAMAAPALGFVLDRVSVPRHADVPQLVIADVDGRAQLAENHRWRAPLADEIGAALSQQLQARFGLADVSRVSAPEGLPVLRLRVDVQRFESLADGETLLWATWSLREPQAKAAAVTCVTQRREKAGAGPAGLVAAWRHALTALATQIGGQIERLASAPDTAGCRALPDAGTG